MSKLKVLELFGGIGACSKALERLGVDYEIADYVEIDKYAVKSFNAIHNTNFEPQDICKWDKDIDVDLIMHGSPCQDFSLAGKQAGGDEGSGTRSSLMYETVRIVDKLKPKYVIWENVKNVISKKHIHNFNNYIDRMSELGYISYYQVLNAKDYGIPQNRERVFTISIRNNLYQGFMFPPKQELKLKLKDMLEENVDEKYYLSERMIEYISADNEKWTGNNKESLINKDVASTINTGEGSRRCDASNYISNQVGENYNLKRPERVLKHLIETNQIKEIPCCCDSTINEPRVRNISNCITARYNAGIQNQKQVGLCVVEPKE
jgi:DNA (cytosine-5)-methyltransferase 1